MLVCTLLACELFGPVIATFGDLFAVIPILSLVQTTRVRVGVISNPFLLMSIFKYNTSISPKKNTEVKLHQSSSTKSEDRTCLLQGCLYQLIKPPPYTDHDLRWTTPSSVHSMPPNIVVDHLLLRPRKLWHDRIVTLDLEAQSFSSIEDHPSGPQTDVELHDLALG